MNVLYNNHSSFVLIAFIPFIDYNNIIIVSLDKLRKSTVFTMNVCENTEMRASGDIAFNVLIASGWPH
jgi:hypothetical protein